MSAPPHGDPRSAPLPRWSTRTSAPTAQMASRAATLDLLRDDETLTGEQAWLMSVVFVFISSILALLGLLLALFVIERFVVSPQLWDGLDPSASWRQIRHLSTVGVTVGFVALTLVVCELLGRTFRDAAARVLGRPGDRRRADLVHQCLCRLVPWADPQQPARLFTTPDDRRWMLKIPLRHRAQATVRDHGDDGLLVRVEAPGLEPQAPPALPGLDLHVERGPGWIEIAMTPRHARRHPLELADALDLTLARVGLPPIPFDALYADHHPHAVALQPDAGALPPDPRLARAQATLDPRRAPLQPALPLTTSWLVAWNRQLGYWVAGGVGASVWLQVLDRASEGGDPTTMPFGVFGATIFLLMFVHRHPTLPRLIPRQLRRAPQPRLSLRGDLLRLDPVGASIDLAAPFTLSLTRDDDLLEVALHQPGDAPGQARRLAFAAPLDPARSPLDIPRLATSSPVVSGADLTAWIWPTLRHRAAIHGQRLPDVQA